MLHLLVTDHKGNPSVFQYKGRDDAQFAAENFSAFGYAVTFGHFTPKGGFQAQ